METVIAIGFYSSLNGSAVPTSGSHAALATEPNETDTTCSGHAACGANTPFVYNNF